MRYVYVILFVVLLGSPFVMRRVLVERAHSSPVGSDSVPKLVVITPHNQDIRREFARAFDAWHFGRYGKHVEVDYRVPGGTNDIKRQLEDTYRSWRSKDGTLHPNFVADVHVAWGGGNYFFESELKPAGILQPLRLDAKLLADTYPEPALSGVRLLEESTDANGVPTPKWVGACLSAYGLVYNPDIFRSLGVPEPTQWRDLADPRLAGQIALADPTHSGSAGIAYMSIVERRMVDAEEALFAERPEFKRLSKAELAKDDTYQAAISAGWKRGMSELLLIAANARYFADSAPQVPADVANGEAAAGIAIDFYGRVYQEVVGPNRCRSVNPVGATVVTPDPVAILEGVRGEQLELAMRFVEFQLVPQGQLLWILRPGVPNGPFERGLRRLPARRDVYDGDRTGWTDDVNPFAESGGFNQRADFETLFSDTRQVWKAAWIDSRESLKSAHAAILRIPDTKRRDELLAELADLPITMQDVAAFRAERKRIEESHASAEQRKARNRIDMVKKFRSHYDDVARRAR